MNKKVLLISLCCLLCMILLAVSIPVQPMDDSYASLRESSFNDFVGLINLDFYLNGNWDITNEEGKKLFVVTDQNDPDYGWFKGNLDRTDIGFVTDTSPVWCFCNVRFCDSFTLRMATDHYAKTGSSSFRVGFFRKDCTSSQSVDHFCGTAVFHSNSTIELYGDTTDVTVSIETKEAKWTVTGSGGLYAKVAVVDGEIETEGLTSYEVERE